MAPATGPTMAQITIETTHDQTYDVRDPNRAYGYVLRDSTGAVVGYAYHCAPSAEAALVHAVREIPTVRRRDLESRVESDPAVAAARAAVEGAIQQQRAAEQHWSYWVNHAGLRSPQAQEAAIGTCLAEVDLRVAEDALRTVRSATFRRIEREQRLALSPLDDRQNHG